MSATAIAVALLLLGVLVLIGKMIRIWVPLVQKLFLPVSIISGFLALVLGPQVIGKIFPALESGGVFGETTIEVWGELPGLLISVVFATMFLGSRIPGFGRAAKLLGPQLSLGVTFATGQYVWGILVTMLVLVPVFAVPPVFASLIEIGFEGGHGTAAGMSTVFEEVGHAELGDLAIAMATVGIVSGVIIGVIAVNWAARTGKSEVLDAEVQTEKSVAKGVYAEDDDTEHAGVLTTRSASLETLTFSFGIVALAIFIGQGMLSFFQWIEQLLWADFVEIFSYVPLFPLAMLGGVIIQLVADRYEPLARLIDRGTMDRIQGFSLDILIIAALATLSLDAIVSNWVPFAILAAVGVAWNCFVLFFLAPRVIPRFWFERGIGDFGQSMGVTATGLLLMRMADPELETPAYEAFGYKQLVFEPFFGGGLITAASVPLIIQFGPWPFFSGMVVALIVALFSGLFYFGKQTEDAVGSEYDVVDGGPEASSQSAKASQAREG